MVDRYVSGCDGQVVAMPLPGFSPRGLWLREFATALTPRQVVAVFRAGLPAEASAWPIVVRSRYGQPV